MVKHEIRNPKFETISNVRDCKADEPVRIEYSIFGFRAFFGFRISCFGFLLALSAFAEEKLPLLKNAFETKPAKPWTFKASDSGASLVLKRNANSPLDLNGSKRLSVNAERLKHGSSVVRLRWVAHSRAAGQYIGASAMVIPAGMKTAVSASLIGEGDWIPVGHQRPWDALAATEIYELELRTEISYASKDNNDEISLKLTEVILEPGQAAETPRLVDLEVEPAPPGYRAAIALKFRTFPLPPDPYAPSGPGDVRVILPNGAQALAFLDQDYAITPDGSIARFTPVGRPYWRAFLPEIPDHGNLEIVGANGRWKFSCTALFGGNESGKRHATDISAPARSTPPATELSIRSLPPAHWQAPLETTLAANRPIPLMTGTEAWTLTGNAWEPLASGAPKPGAPMWRPIPFWNAAWGGFGGRRHPDGELALRMDALLRDAAEKNVSKPLVLLDGESLERQGVFNWDSHPLRGALSGPGEILRSEAGFDFCARWMRYCLARWGQSKAVSALWITSELNTPGAPEFHAKLAKVLREWPRDTSLPVCSLHPMAVQPHAISEIENGWNADVRAEKSTSRHMPGGIAGSDCFEIRALSPATTALTLANLFRAEISDWRRTANDDFSGADTLLFDVWLPPNSPADLRVGIHVRDRDEMWFDTLLPGMARPGDWTTYSLDISGRNLNGLKPVAHRKAWTDYSRGRIREVGLHLFSTHPNWRPEKSSAALQLTARFDNIRAVRFRNEAQQKVEIALFDPSAVEGISRAAAPAQKDLAPGALWECHFKINKTFSNPFDARSCDLVAVVTTPSKKQIRVPAFFNQLCERREATPGGNEVVEPYGNEFFTVRFRATEPGPHSVTIELSEGGKYEVARSYRPDTRFTSDGKAQTAIIQGNGGWPPLNYPERSNNGKRPIDTITFLPGEITATLALPSPAFVVGAKKDSAFHGFVRVSADKRHFEFDDGTFFYPLGPCLRSPSDSRIPYASPKWSLKEIDRIGKRGTYQYDDYFKEFQRAGINWARVWMCSWWGALEWRRDWPGYQGLARYNLLNAWRIDYILEQAEQKDIKINLCLTNHGQYSLIIDSEWKNNPYNSRLGGPLIAAGEFFTKSDAKIAHQNKLRYCAARFGHSPAILAWALFSELEFTEEYDPSAGRWLRGGGATPDSPAPNVEKWHSEMASYLKMIDPNQHLVTTHFSHPERGYGTLAVPEIDIATSNAYSAFPQLNKGNNDASAALDEFWRGNDGGQYSAPVRGFSKFKKPVLVEEQGRHWMGVTDGREFNKKGELDADLHTGLWGSIVQPLAGATGYWWWLHLHFDNRYADYRALANFTAGEDLRPIGDETTLEPVFRKVASGGDVLRGRAMKSDRRMYAWIYHEETPFGRTVPDVNDGVLNIGGLKAGEYTIEFWDTYAGAVTETRKAAIAAGASIEIKLPVVRKDLAVKIKPAK